MSNDLERMDRWIAGILAGLSPSMRAQATRKIAQYIRGSQSRRIGAQKNPDGSGFEPRRRAAAPPKPSNRPIKFLYPEGGSGAPRAALLKSWVRKGANITGYDVKAGAIRSFTISKITRWLRPTAAERASMGAAVRPRARQRNRAMFNKLRRFGHLRAGSTAQEAWVGFNGLAGHIAGVSQHGEYEKPGPNQEPVRYAERQLLGLTPDDENHVVELLIAMFDDD